MNGSPENEKSDGNTDDKRKFPTDSLDLSFPSAFRSINQILDIFTGKPKALADTSIR